MNKLANILVASSALALVIIASPASAGVSIYAGYDAFYNDTSYFQIVSDHDLTNASFSGTGTSGSATGLTGTWNLGDVQAGDTGPLYFFNYSYDVFQYDFDDFFTGEASYTFTASDGGTPISLSFSPSNNLSGTFQPFLGNDAGGYEYDVNSYALVAQSVAAVPEPATWAMMLLGFGMMGATMRYRRKSTAVSFA